MWPVGEEHLVDALLDVSHCAGMVADFGGDPEGLMSPPRHYMSPFYGVMSSFVMS